MWRTLLISVCCMCVVVNLVIGAYLGAVAMAIIAFVNWLLLPSKDDND